MVHFSTVMKEVEENAERLVDQHLHGRERVLRRVDTVHLSDSQPTTSATSPLKQDEELMTSSLSRPQNCWSSAPGSREGLCVSPDNSRDALGYSPNRNSVPSYSPMQ